MVACLLALTTEMTDSLLEVVIDRRLRVMLLLPYVLMVPIVLRSREYVSI
jgi:hypothetical protein